MTKPYETEQPSRESIDALSGPAILQFGTNWCSHCTAAEPIIEAALARLPGLQRLKIEDGKGRPLGRSFHVKLWPTLVFLQDGREVARVVRPGAAQDISSALQSLSGI